MANPYQGQAGHAPKKVKYKGIRERITDSVSDFFGSIPTGVNAKERKMHTIDDATDELRQYRMKKKK